MKIEKFKDSIYVYFDETEEMTEAAAWDFLESEGENYDAMGFIEIEEIQRRAVFHYKYETVDSGYLKMIYGKPDFQHREEEAYDYLERETDLTRLWDESPETAWADVVTFPGHDVLFVLAGDTEITADGTFYLVRFHE